MNARYPGGQYTVTAHLDFSRHDNLTNVTNQIRAHMLAASSVIMPILIQCRYFLTNGIS